MRIYVPRRTQTPPTDRVRRYLAAWQRAYKLPVMTLGHDATAGRSSDLGLPIPKDHAYLFCSLRAQDDGSFVPARHVLPVHGEVAIGRSTTRSATRTPKGARADLALRYIDPWMSGNHAVILCEGGKFTLRDSGSRNHSFVNGAKVTEAMLEDGDILELGNLFFVFRRSLFGAPGESDDALASDLHQVDPLRALSPPLARIFERVTSVAPSALSVFLGGETGTGKEVVARAIHDRSKRTGAFIAVNCAAIAPNLVESELFGYRKGAFSGATENRPGLVKSAHGGTLFLDEIGDMPLPAQAALLRVLQEREVLAVGATEPTSVDIRVVAATHKNLDDLVKAGTFRADLQARLMGLTVHLPALRDRMEDLGLLVHALARRHFPKGACPPLSLAAARRLFACPFPFNIRELDRRVAGAAALAGGGAIEPSHLLFEDDELPTRPNAPSGSTAAPSIDDGITDTHESVALTEEDEQRKAWLLALLDEHQWNVSAVARASGKARMQIQRWMIRFDLRR